MLKRKIMKKLNIILMRTMIHYFTGRNIEFLIWEKSLLGAPPIQVNYNVLVIISFPENMTVMDV